MSAVDLVDILLIFMDKIGDLVDTFLDLVDKLWALVDKTGSLVDKINGLIDPLKLVSQSDNKKTSGYRGPSQYLYLLYRAFFRKNRIR